MDAEQEKALLESIERNMDNVIQSMHNHNRDRFPDTDTHATEKSKSGVIAPEMLSPLSPWTGTSSIGSGLTSATEKPVDGVTGEGIPGLSLSADNFEETFSEGSEDGDLLNGGMPVDSMVNFVPPANQSGENAGEARRKERGVISAHGAEEKDTRRPTVKIRIPPRDMEDEVNEEVEDVEEQTGRMESGEVKEVTETKEVTEIDLPRRKKSSNGKGGKGGTPKGPAGRLMKKLTSGFRRKRSYEGEG